MWLQNNHLSGCFPESLRALCGKDVEFYGNPGLPNGGNFTAFCNQEPGSNAIPAPTLSLKSGIIQPIALNTASVSLTVSGCEGGTINWSATNTTLGSGATIPVGTSTPGNVVYSATCTSGGCTSAPARFTVTVAAAPAAGNYDGHLYGADCETFRGWVWNRDKVNTPVAVEILDGSAVIATILADGFRQDLLNAGKGNGKHAFTFPIPDWMKDGRSHPLSARVAGGSFLLKGSPKALVCQAPTTPPANQPPVAPTINTFTSQQGATFSALLPAFTDPEGGPLAYSVSGLPGGLSFNPTTRQLSGTPGQSGSFWLTYTATDNQNATTSVSVGLTINAPATTPVTGNFDGYLDKVECGTIRGWAWDRNKPNAPVSIEFYTGNTVWGSTVANIYRDDLKQAGKGNGAHAYSFEVPAVLKDNKTRQISARVTGSSYVLKWSGKALTCSPSSGRLSAERSAQLELVVLGNPTTGDAVEVEVRGAAGQPLRLQLTDATGRMISERRVDQPRTVERQTLPLGNRPAGLLLLQAVSGTRYVTLKVVKQ
ncbi:putative Ig domain-containing protein [Larkinella insperata]|uniref:Ig domain-containing protein n=1 Tax=Larkinella insperata TaxID=332158 RepID=A0ABW3QIK4_9BACT|nr:putative Ig domain-containing protein [Larkinella insperata]